MTQAQGEAERIRSYLTTQANKLSIPDLVEKVRVDVTPLKQVASLIPAERLTERPAEGEWSAAEVWTHILQMNDHGARAITGILDSGQQPESVRDAISGDTAGFRSGEEYYEAFLQRREEFLARVVQAKGDEHPAITIHHPMFGDLTWREWLLFMRVHDLDHLRQLQGVAAALGIQEQA